MKKLFLTTLVTILVGTSAHAATFSRSSSSSFSSRPSVPSYRPAPVYRAPAPVAPVVQRPVIVQKNVTVQQNVTHVTQSSGGGLGGGGFFSSLIGSFAGSSLSHWLVGGSSQPAPQPQQAIDCRLEQNKGLAVCQPAK